LRKESNDKRLPAPERRRLSQIREMCKELDCVIRHIPSELNFADSITRAKLDFGRGIVAKEVEASLRSRCVVYDYREGPEPVPGDTDESEEGCIKVMALNVDGIDLPSFEGYSDEEVDELKALERYAAPDGPYEEGILNDVDFERCVAACVRRCQSSDDNLRRFKLYLNGDITKGQLGMDATKLQRL
ncbi:hypothetical protein FOZ63_021247, partial [Perkinsus olseni]